MLLCNVFSGLAMIYPPIWLLLLFLGVGGVGHGGVGGYVYMYKHTEVNFSLGPFVYVLA